MKYKTLAELKAAYDSGELGREATMILDNDCTPVYTEDGDTVFEGGTPDDLLREALTLLGIPWEPA